MRLVFDIGAHRGENAQRFLSEGARVIAVEPQANLTKWLRGQYNGDKSIVIVEKACGPQIGKVMLYACAKSWLATCVPDKWIQGRFNGYIWKPFYEVEMTTIDSLIEEYGLPDFIKIDVEGYEPEVLSGLTQPVAGICFEFTIEFLDDARKCVDYLSNLGDYEFAAGIYSREPNEYQDAESLFDWITEQPPPLLWGDIYARLK